jgi:hypothetical protein
VFGPNQTIRTRFPDEGAVNEVTMDAQGFCNPTSVNPSAPNFPIIALGDSFTWCTTVNPEDTWPAQLARLTGASVYNLGRPRTGLHEYAQLFKAFGAAKSPQTVVVNIYEGNDLRDAVAFTSHISGLQVETRALATEALTTVGRFVELLRTGWIARHSYAHNLALISSLRAYEMARVAVASRDPRVARAGQPNFRYTLQFESGPIAFNPENADVDEIVHARAVVQGRIGLGAFDEALDTLKGLALAGGFELLLSYSPSAHIAYAEYAEFEDLSVQSVMMTYSERLRAYFADASQRRGIAFIDLTPRTPASCAPQAGT